MEIPKEIHTWINNIFSDCNIRLSEKISNNPNTPETSLDVTFIEHLSRHASPLTFENNWTVRIDTHFIGGRRHFFGWEIADIGVLIFFKKNGRIIKKKVALLQSKRLYPLSGVVEEETREDIAIGISVLLQGQEQGTPISSKHIYKFDKNSRYKALKVKDHQYDAIRNWNNETTIPVYYLFYNTWSLPFSQSVPLLEFKTPKGECKLGARVIPSETIIKHLEIQRKGYSPSIGELQKILPKPHSWKKNLYGWRLESFFSDLINCEHGYIFDTVADSNIDRLFYRKDAMLGAAIAISVELSD